MKTILISVLISVFAVTFTFGQITIKPIAQKQEAKKAPYDSTQNFVKGEVYQYIGQELYLLPKAESLRKYGYEAFYIDYQSSHYKNQNVFKCCYDFKNESGATVTRCCQTGNAPYDSIQGKYFKVLDVVNYDGEIYLKLVEKSLLDTVYFNYKPTFEHIFPFMVVGYFEKLKRQDIGKNYVIRYNEKDLTDINSGKQIDFINGSTWKCVDITIENKYFTMVHIFENNKGEQIESDVNYGHLDYWIKSLADKYKAKCGIYWQSVLDKKLKVGMTKEMVKLSWGEPDKINNASYGEQWIYDKQFVYFKNGAMTGFNEAK